MLVNANDPTTHTEDGFEEMQARAKSRGMKIPYVVDDTSAVARAFGASVTPEAFLFDKTGKLAYHGADRRQPQGAGQGEGALPEGRARRGVAGKAPAVARDQGPRLRHQVPQLAISSAR